MPVSALKATSTARNGVGAYILQCKSISLNYCDWGGSSRGIRSFLKSSSLFPQFAKHHPSIQLIISPRPNHHPVITAHYINGREKAICVKNLEATAIAKKLEILRDASGEKLKKVKAGRMVGSGGEASVRGIWNALQPGHHPAEVPPVHSAEMDVVVEDGNAEMNAMSAGQTRTKMMGTEMLSRMTERVSRNLVGGKKKKTKRKTTI